jgi:hypothetical protein
MISPISQSRGCQIIPILESPDETVALFEDLTRKPFLFFKEQKDRDVVECTDRFRPRNNRNPEIEICIEVFLFAWKLLARRSALIERGKKSRN